MTEERLKEIQARTEGALSIRRAIDEQLHVVERSPIYDIPDLVAALREARELLHAFISDGAESELFGACCYCLKSIPEHEPDCHWLMAKQLLEATE